MKKIWMMLLMISTVFAFSACSDDDDDKVPVNPVIGATTNSPVKIGEVLQVTGKGFAEGAQFYFKNENGQSDAFKANVTSSGASFTVPLSMKPGKYTLMLKQDGDWEIGEVTLDKADIPVEGFKVPATAMIGRTMTIEGAGFNETSEVYLQKEGVEPIELSIVSEDFAAGLICEIPSELEAGSYTVIFKQDGGEWTLADELVVEKAPKRLKKVTKEVNISAYDIVIQTSYSISWQNDEPTEFTVSYNGQEITYTIQKTDKQIIGSTESEDAQTKTFTLTLDGDKVSQTIANEYRQKKWAEHIREWQYTNEGHLNLLYDEYYENEKGSPERIIFGYTSNNLVDIGVNGNIAYTFNYTDKAYNQHGIEWAACYAILTAGDIIEDNFYVDLSFAVLTNMIGKKSVSFPEKLDDMVFKYTSDNDNYLVRVDWEDISMGVSAPAPAYVTFEYEE